MNMMPVRRTGNRMISDPVLPEKDLKNTPMPKKRRMKIKPPNFSDFHAIISAIRSKKVGMLCIRNPAIFLPAVSVPSKTSSENIIMKRMAHMAKALGNQYSILIIMAGLAKCLTGSSLMWNWLVFVSREWQDTKEFLPH